MPAWHASPSPGVSTSTRRSAFAHLTSRHGFPAMISGDHTILNSGSATGQDVFPFKTSISMLMLSSPLRAAHPLIRGLQVASHGFQCQTVQNSKRGIDHDGGATLDIPALVDPSRCSHFAEPRDGHAAKFWAVSALDHS